MKRCILIVFVLSIIVFIVACSYITYHPIEEQVVLAHASAGTDIHRALEDLSDIIGHRLPAEDMEVPPNTLCWSRFDDFIYTEEIRSLRRGIVMDAIIHWVPPSCYSNDRYTFECRECTIWAMSLDLGFTRHDHVLNERLLDALQELMGVCRNNSRFDVAESLAIGMIPTRHSLNSYQLYFLEQLEAFMAKVNTPFWEDMHNNDPVITHIGIPAAPESALCYPLFTIWLYDPDLLELNLHEFNQATAELRQQINEFTNATGHRLEMRVNRYEG
ncbi:MAG: hypothetical protein FWE11_10190 [Defluviitaleaceae bacterium]|nr:hypothetical protein [Defluviitaleaceae bacterium]